jgi:hypothetical protein
MTFVKIADHVKKSPPIHHTAAITGEAKTTAATTDNPYEMIMMAPARNQGHRRIGTDSQSTTFGD